ncbi:MAG: endonuclease/exonuclease/phosphatase family protein [Candidatus Paceibacterota bacterium]
MQLKVLSWNIWDEGHFDEIAQFLKSSEADIIGLQEVLPFSKNIPIIEFLTSLGYKHVYAPARLSSGEREEMGNAVFSKYPIVSNAVHVLSEENKRIAVQADIAVEGKIVYVFSVHLLHTHQQSSGIQELQAENLLKVLPQERVIVMGDFNAIPESVAVQKMRSVLTDTDTTSAPTWSVYPEGCPVCNPQKIDIRLDYIFVSSDIKTITSTVEVSNGSDHLPISAIIEM